MACWIRSLAIGCAIVVALVGSRQTSGDTSAGKPDVLPRYKLSVGQELVYRIGRQTVTFYVTGSNPDGGWHIFELYRFPELMSSKGVPATPALECEFDLTPEGKVSSTQAAAFIHATKLLPPLPPDASTAHWEANGPQEELLHFHELPSTQPSLRTLEVEIEGPLMRAGGIRASSQISFDTARGVPVRFENHSEYTATHKEGAAVTELIENKLHSAGWAKQIANDGGALLLAQSRYWDEMHSASETTDDSQYSKACDAALEHLKQARSRLTFPDFIESMDTFVGLHGRQVFFGRGPEALLGQPAPAWQFTDLERKRHALADYRGKVVVLDFWYRRCPYCILEMPHLKNVVTQFADKPVVFLGMNVDLDPQDAQAMVTEQGLTFPTLITRGLARPSGPTTRPAAGFSMIQSYHVKGYPTLIVVGPDGIIRKIGPAFSDTFEENLAKAIASLLPVNN